MRVTIWVTAPVYQVGCANSVARALALNARQTDEEDHAKEHEDDKTDEYVTLAVGRGLQRSVLIG